MMRNIQRVEGATPVVLFAVLLAMSTLLLCCAHSQSTDKGSAAGVQITLSQNVSESGDSVLDVSLRNTSSKEIKIRYDRYDREKGFQGQFVYNVTNSNGSVMPLTNYGKSLTRPRSGVYSRSWTAFTIKPGEQQTVGIRIGRIVDMSVPDTYSVEVVFAPIDQSSISGSYASNKAQFVVQNDILVLAS